MKCEFCHKVEAELAVFRVVDGAEREFFICRGCAAASAEAGVAGEQGAGTSERNEDVSDALMGSPMLPLMGMILDAAFDIVGGTISMGRQPKCKVCGITRGEYRKAARLGCPGCYDSFVNELKGTVMDLQRTVEYKGRAPERFRHELEVSRLEAQLSSAVAEQRYEEAITLRDRIREMEGEVDA